MVLGCNLKISWTLSFLDHAGKLLKIELTYTPRIFPQYHFSLVTKALITVPRFEGMEVGNASNVFASIQNVFSSPWWAGPCLYILKSLCYLSFIWWWLGIYTFKICILHIQRSQCPGSRPWMPYCFSMEIILGAAGRPSKSLDWDSIVTGALAVTISCASIPGLGKNQKMNFWQFKICQIKEGQKKQ